jgi:imidazolonepropionase-like amidohydrolase
MRLATGTTLVAGGTLIDGTGAAPLSDASLLIDEGRIAYAGPAATAPEIGDDTYHIDASGCSVIPGLIESHWHASYFNVLVLEDLDIAHPPEKVAIRSAFNAKVALECGYTSARSAGCLFNVDVWLSEAIDEDLMSGPRFTPGGQEICGAGGLMDWNPEFRKIGMEGVILVVDGPDQARSAARRLVKNGVHWLKAYPTGDAAAPDTNDHHTLSMTFEEMEAVVQVAHNHRRKVMGHCRANEGIKMALRAGFDSIEHATFMDQEALDLMLDRNVPAVPGLQFERASIERGADFGMPQAVIDGHKETLEGGVESARMIHEAGGVLGLGGDYGFAWNPHGEYAKELTFFVNEVGLSPLDVITCATLNGAKILGMESDTGTLEAGKLGDVVIVEGDVTTDIACLEDRSNIRRVLQGGITKAGTESGFGTTNVPSAL